MASAASILATLLPGAAAQANAGASEVAPAAEGGFDVLLATHAAPQGGNGESKRTKDADPDKGAADSAQASQAAALTLPLPALQAVATAPPATGSTGQGDTAAPSPGRPFTAALDVFLAVQTAAGETRPETAPADAATRAAGPAEAPAGETAQSPAAGAAPPATGNKPAERKMSAELRAALSQPVPVSTSSYGDVSTPKTAGLKSETSQPITAAAPNASPSTAASAAAPVHQNATLPAQATAQTAPQSAPQAMSAQTAAPQTTIPQTAAQPAQVPTAAPVAGAASVQAPPAAPAGAPEPVIEAPEAAPSASATTGTAEVVADAAKTTPPGNAFGLVKPPPPGRSGQDAPETRAPRSENASERAFEAVAAAGARSAHAPLTAPEGAAAGDGAGLSDLEAAPAEHTAATDSAPPADEAGAAATAAAAPPGHALAAANQLKAAVQTMTHLAAQIVSKAAGKTTQFEVALDPIGLGHVNVQLQIDAAGALTAALSFDNPQAAAELRARAAELHRALSAAGFDLAEGALSFDVAADSGSGQGRQSAWDFSDLGERGLRAITAFSEDNAPTAAHLAAALRRAAGGLDIRI